MKTFNDIDYKENEINDFDKSLLSIKIHLNNLNFILNSVSDFSRSDKTILDLKKESKILYFDKVKKLKNMRYRRRIADIL